MDELVGILKRELDEFMATHASSVLANIGESGMDPLCLAQVDRVGTMWTAMAARNFAVTVETMLAWQETKLDGSLFGRAGLWLTGHVLQAILRHPLRTQDDGAMDALWGKLVTTALKILAEWNEIESSTNSRPTSEYDTSSSSSSGLGGKSSFFAFRPAIAVKPTNDLLLQEAVHGLWKENLGLMGAYAIRPIKQQVLADLESPPRGISKECYLTNLTTLRLALIRPTNAALHDQAASFLRVLVTCTHKANKVSVQLAALHVLSAILTRELQGLTTAGLRAYHDVSNAAEWDAIATELHATAVKLSTKKAYAAVAWRVRLAVVMLSSADVFARHWKEDAVALLEAYGSTKGAVPYLQLVETLLCNLVKRHLASGRTMPVDSDMMEIINTIQAWCFTNTKHKLKKLRVIFATLARLTQCIAAYNMEYAIQNHVHRLLVESDSVFEIRRLVGLLSLKVLFQQAGLLVGSEPTYLALDAATLAANCTGLGDVVGNVLVDCSSHFDSGCKTSEFKQWISLQTFEAAIVCTQFLYGSMKLPAEQKMHILMRSTAHSHMAVGMTAVATLQRLAITQEDFVVFRALVSYMLRLDNTVDAPLLLVVLQLVLHDPDLPLLSGLEEELAPLEALALFLLCHNNPRVRQPALVVLDAIRTIRQTRLKVAGINAMDIVTGIDADLQKKLNLTASDKQEALQAGGVIQWLVSLPTPREWLWSLALGTLFPRVCEICPLLVDRVWASAVDSVLKMEPAIPDVDDNDSARAPTQWRNLAIFTCATAAAGEDERIKTLLRHQSAYLRSPSVGQRLSAVVALGATRHIAHGMLLDVLSTFEEEAFVVEEIASPKRVKASQIQQAVHHMMALQWALARCHRSLVEHHVHMWENSQCRQHVLRFVDKLHAAATSSLGEFTSPGWVWWIRLDFCAIVESVVHQSNMSYDDDTVYITPKMREQWFLAASTWCAARPGPPPIASSADLLPTGYDTGSTYTLTKGAYSAMAMLLIGPTFDTAPCFLWIDVCFALTEADELQSITASGLRLLLQSDPTALIPPCVDRCFFADVATSNVAKQYLGAVASVIGDLRDEFQSSTNLCELLFVALLHLYHKDNQAAVHILVTMLDHDLPGPFQPSIKTYTRQVQLVTTHIAARWTHQSMGVLQLMIVFVTKCKDPLLQAHVLALCGPWVQQLQSIDGPFLTLLFRLTHDQMQVPMLPSVWLDVARAKAYTHLASIVSFFYGLATKEKIQTAKAILNWITPSPDDTQQVLARLMTHAQGTTTFAATGVTVMLLAGLSSQLDDSFCVGVSHRAFSILHAEMFDDTTRDEMFDGIADDCLMILETMVHKDTLGYDSLLNNLHEYLAMSQSTDPNEAGPTVAHFEELLECFCLSLTDVQRVEWAQTSVLAFTKHKPGVNATFSLLLYRLLRAPFDGAVCVQLLNLLKIALDNADAAGGCASEFLLTLTYVAESMPETKLVLYPQLLWVAVALLNHSQESFELPALQLLYELVRKQTFCEPIVQDVLAARRPPQWKSKDVSTDVLLAVCRHMDSPETDAVVRAIVQEVLGSKVTSKLHCVVCTAVLLPHLCAQSLEPSRTFALRQELSYLWRMQQRQDVAVRFLKPETVLWKLTDDLGRRVMSALTSPEEEKAFFDVLLVVLNGQCTDLVTPTLGILQVLLQTAPPMFWKRNATLLSALTRMLRTTSANHETWPILVSLMSTLLPCP
ncbi:Aste57867_18335 [Aphanomyces stellatus]|uniref:Aste57867_18335 protein n=1 Tax=Aphanomyces stellatus TaxID=120398 RepID=A0A485LBJ8_9STRA|nr:hypothetical protein As57867_018273 [Aphanomyces stellatus]VFT95071.1 Aste57867_18335 [Aphanomyces stellatus]